MKVIKDVSEIPEGMSEEEEARFWEEHEFGEGVAFHRPSADDPELPPARARGVTVDLPEEVLEGLREVAHSRGMSVRRLLRSLKGTEPKRSGPIAVPGYTVFADAKGKLRKRFEDDTVTRLKVLAERKGMGYQTLLKEFVVERLYEEEKRVT